MVYFTFEYMVADEGDARITRCMQESPDVVIPGFIEGRPVTALGSESFARLASIEHVTCPSTLREIGARAFAGCRRLKGIRLNDGLVAVGDGAFTNTVLREFDLPASCTELAPRALVIGPAPDGQPIRAHHSNLTRISVADGNKALCMEGTVLCKRVDFALEAVAAPARARDVRLSQRVRTVREGTFAATREIGTLHIHEELRYEGTGGLLPHGACKRLIVDLAREVDGAMQVDIEIPSGSIGEAFIADSLSSGRVDCALLLHTYDEMLDALPSSHEKARLVAARLARPTLLRADMRERLSRFASGNIGNICASFGARNHLSGFGDLVDAGILDAIGISDAVSALTRRGDTAAAGRLLELKRARFGKAVLDYAL